ncbi:putative Ovate family protein 4 [Hibiscus syriacus]|uniref:Ovate family protein 4 n=1 Tax=Hibiscus syriacus TaxID=106335 RepID=A0A6A2ZAX4_HIBSY|nr:transcription repressor OFP17-like [Hibiscus syriacus]KAE8688559.1 putative Ovate family protein 4 [Hibiscus syriacus]
MKSLIPFKSKFLNPCKKLVPIFKFKLKRPVFIRPLRFRLRKALQSSLRSIFRLLRPRRKMDAELRSISEAAGCNRDMLLFSSPLTPASYMKVGGGSRKRASSDVEDACRSFENYLVEMIVEEGKVSDLMDVEELLYCWKNLTSPVFIDLVSRFYGELCTDLFSGTDDDNADTP